MRPIQSLFVDDRAVLVAIVLNALVLFFLGFRGLAQDPLLVGLDYAFTTYFVVEAALKIRLAGSLRAYLGDGWNRFDLSIVVFSMPSYLLLVFDVPDLTFLYLIRLVRLLKFFRYFRFVPRIDQLLLGVRRAIRASGMIVVGLFLFTFIASLLSCHLFGNIAPERFGDPLTAFYTTFQIFTVEGWNDIPEDVTMHLEGAAVVWTRIYFMALVVGGGILGLSIVNAMFVDEMLRNENDLFEEYLTRIDGKVDALARAVAHLQSGEGRGDEATVTPTLPFEGPSRPRDTDAESDRAARRR